MTTTSYCTRCGGLVVRDELGTWTSLSEQRVATDEPVLLSETCPVTQEHHRPEADEAYRGPRDFASEEAEWDSSAVHWREHQRFSAYTADQL